MFKRKGRFYPTLAGGHHFCITPRGQKLYRPEHKAQQVTVLIWTICNFRFHRSYKRPKAIEFVALTHSRLVRDDTTLRTLFFGSALDRQEKGEASHHQLVHSRLPM